MKTPATEITLRHATAQDASALTRVAELDSRPLPPGPHLVSVRNGAIDAAISLSNGDIVANPFVRTAELCELLRLQAGPKSSSATRRPGLRARPIGALT